MDTTSLRAAYDGLLDAGEQVASAPASSPPSGEWDAGQLLAHIVSVDAAVLAAAYSITAGGHGTFDNRQSLDPWNLARITARAGDQAQLRRRILVQADALCSLAEELSDDELRQPVPTLLLSRDVVLVDEPVRLGDLIGGLAEDHLPRHTQQLLGLLPPATVSPARTGSTGSGNS